MKYLVGIPCLYGPVHTKEAIDSIVNHPNVDIVLIDNGAEPSVKDVLSSYSHMDNVTIIRNPHNIYVNPAWNQILSIFLNSDCDRLLIMNSDLILHKDWVNVLDYYLSEYPEAIPVPVIENNKSILNKTISLSINHTLVTEGTPGVLIIINRNHAEKVYPIPETLKVWFGDNWIYDGLRKLGYKTMVLNNLLSCHYWSQNVSKVKGISEIIEQDKLEWAKLNSI